MKRGQVSVFIIIALVVVAGVVGFFIFKNINQENNFENKDFNDQTEIITNSVLDCFTEVCKESLDKVGLQGGYYYEPLTMYIDTGLLNTPFYYFGELSFIPPIELIEEELVYAVDSKKTRCLDLISNYGIDYDFNYQLSNVSIKEDKVDFLLNLDLTLIKGEETTNIDFKEYPIEVKSKIKEMNSFASYITYSHQINEGSLSVSSFIEIADNKGFAVEFLNNMDNILLVNIIDSEENYPNAYSFLLTDLPEEVTNPITPKGFSERTIQTDETEDELNIIAPKIENE